MTRVAYALVALFLIATPAFAQHPCDLPEDPAAQATPTKGTRLAWCSPAVDDDGVAVDTFNFAIAVNGTTVANWQNASPDAIGQAVNGRFSFSFALPSKPRGNYTVTVAQFNELGSSPTSNGVAWQVGGKPVKPTTVAVKK